MQLFHFRSTLRILRKLYEWLQVASGQWWRLLSATFMHAGLLHLAVNSGALYYIAPEAEAVYGCDMRLHFNRDIVHILFFYG
jgi:membrane associated rhomboid family serine protease